MKKFISFLSNKVVTGLVLFLSLSTSIAILLIILRLAPSIESISNLLAGERYKIFDRNLQVNTLIPENELKVSKILGDQIEISCGPQLNHLYTRIAKDRVDLQAKSFALQSGQELTFDLPDKVDTVEVKNNIKEIRLIKSPSKEINSYLHNSSQDLKFVSSKTMELSGNLGLVLHSKESHVSSTDSIQIESRGRSIRFESSKGIMLPSLKTNNQQYYVYGERGTNVCIDRSNGLMTICPNV